MATSTASWRRTLRRTGGPGRSRSSRALSSRHGRLPQGWFRSGGFHRGNPPDGLAHHPQPRAVRHAVPAHGPRLPVRREPGHVPHGSACLCPCLCQAGQALVRAIASNDPSPDMPWNEPGRRNGPAHPVDVSHCPGLGCAVLGLKSRIDLCGSCWDRTHRDPHTGTLCADEASCSSRPARGIPHTARASPSTTHNARRDRASKRV